VRGDFNQKRSKRTIKAKRKTTPKPAKTGNNQFVVHSSKDKVDAASSADGHVLNDEDVNVESNNSFTDSTAVADVSSFALTHIFMSHFDIQTNEDSPWTAQRFMERMSEGHVSGG
jgi:hypothetical protein